MKTERPKSRKLRPPELPPPASETLTRAEVAKALGCSIPTVRRMEGTTLHPLQDADGVHRFAPLEVLQVVRERGARALDTSKEGERDARIFEMFDAGHGIREVVTTLRLPIDAVIKAFSLWQDAGRRDLVIPPACRMELEKYLGSAKDAAQLVQLVRSIDTEYEQLIFENSKMSNQLAGLFVVIGDLAARYCEVEDALPALREELDAQQIERLDHAVIVRKQQFATATSGMASTPAESSH